MTDIGSFLTCIAVLFGLGLVPVPAQAQLARTFVSSFGNDANNCDRPTPCRTFQAAHAKTFTNGEVTVLDTGGYGALMITKSISIVNEVGEASILVSGGAVGIAINAGPADYVNLRGISIQGIGFGGGTGLVFNSGFALTIENCVIRNHTSDGMIFQPEASSSLSMSNTLIADNGAHGIAMGPDSASMGPVKASFSRVEFYNNSRDGIILDGNLGAGMFNVTVVDSVFNNNLVGAFEVETSTGHATVNLMVVRSVMINNALGLSAFGPLTTVRVGQSTITANSTSWAAANGASVQSFGDNNIAGNGDGDPAPPVIAKK